MGHHGMGMYIELWPTMAEHMPSVKSCCHTKATQKATYKELKDKQA